MGLSDRARRDKHRYAYLPWNLQKALPDSVQPLHLLRTPAAGAAAAAAVLADQLPSAA